MEISRVIFHFNESRREMKKQKLFHFDISAKIGQSFIEKASKQYEDTFPYFLIRKITKPNTFSFVSQQLSICCCQVVRKKVSSLK